MAPSTKVFALGLKEERKRVLLYVEAGAAGYILKDDSLDDKIENVRAAVDDKVFVSPEITATMMERLFDLAQMFPDIENSAQSYHKVVVQDILEDAPGRKMMYAGVPVVHANITVETLIVLGSEEWIALRSTRDGNQEILHIRPDGTNLENLTQNPANDYFPSGQMDGLLIAFVSTRGGNPEIYTMTDTGGAPNKVGGLKNAQPGDFLKLNFRGQQ